MKVKAVTSASAIVWGGCMLGVGLANLKKRTYGSEFLHVMSSLYPGFHHSRTVKDVLVGAGYGAVDGAVAGLVFGCIYRRLSGPEGNPAVESSEPESHVRASGTPLRRAS